jgi:hypothetical protein
MEATGVSRVPPSDQQLGVFCAVRAAGIEPLEARRLLDAVPLGGEFFVNATSPRGRGAPDVAIDDDGGFAVVSSGPDEGSPEGSAIYAQRYDASGNPTGTELRVSPDTPGTDLQFDASLAMDGDGDFVVTWTQGPWGTDDWDIYARRFNADGSPAGVAFRVNTTRTAVEHRRRRERGRGFCHRLGKWRANSHGPRVRCGRHAQGRRNHR